MIKKIELSWIVVADIEKAIEFYTKTIGLKISDYNKENGWAELSGDSGGSRLGLAQARDEMGLFPGNNAVVTMTVENIIKAKDELSQKGVHLVGGVIEIPSMVKLQLFIDPDGNKMQLVENIH